MRRTKIHPRSNDNGSSLRTKPFEREESNDCSLLS
jgi:hypothetical protein